MTKIIDATVPASPKGVPGHLAELSYKCVALANGIRERLPRSDKSIALANFCIYVGGELEQMFRFYPDNVPGLVWCARNLFEVNLIVRYVLASDGNFRTWLGQALQDEKEYIEGALAVAEQGSEQFQAQLRSRLAELDKLASRHELDFSKSFRVPSLAKDLGMVPEAGRDLAGCVPRQSANICRKRQPTRWSADGAHLLLQVRCAVLDDRLEKRSFGNGSLDSGQPVA